jgi:hypothetical protein
MFKSEKSSNRKKYWESKKKFKYEKVEYKTDFSKKIQKNKQNPLKYDQFTLNGPTNTGARAGA